MRWSLVYLLQSIRRSPRGERGLKYEAIAEYKAQGGRSPRGERGLKFTASFDCIISYYVAPPAGSVD